MTVEHEQIRAWLVTTGAVRSACDLDLLRFFTRHSHSLLTTEQIANFVGYSQREVDGTLEHFLTGGLVTRVRGRSAEVDLYALGEVASSNTSVSSLLDLASTRDGRLAVIDALKPARIAKGVTNAES